MCPNQFLNCKFCFTEFLTIFSFRGSFIVYWNPTFSPSAIWCFKPYKTYIFGKYMTTITHWSHMTNITHHLRLDPPSRCPRRMYLCIQAKKPCVDISRIQYPDHPIWPPLSTIPLDHPVHFTTQMGWLLDDPGHLENILKTSWQLRPHRPSWLLTTPTRTTRMARWIACCHIFHHKAIGIQVRLSHLSASNTCSISRPRLSCSFRSRTRLPLKLSYQHMDVFVRQSILMKKVSRSVD